MRRIRSKSGFTLLEIILVIAIMGFLIAMIAPRLRGVGSEAQSNVDRTNLQRVSQVLGISVSDNSRLPNRLVSIVSFDGTNYTIPSIGDQDNPGGVLNRDFVEDNDLTIHLLNLEEVTALRDMGVTTVLLLETSTTTLMEANVAVGLGVAMVGGGGNAASPGAMSAVTPGNFAFPDGIYRMIFGVSNDCSLVTDGLIDSAPTSPLSASLDEYTYGFYNIIFPRLAATVARTGDTTAVTATGDGSAEGQVKTVDLTQGQDEGQFAIMSPEGVPWPIDDENELWAVTL